MQRLCYSRPFKDVACNVSTVQGHIETQEELIDFEGGKGYIEKDWGGFEVIEKILSYKI